MSGHADTIRRYLVAQFSSKQESDEACAALDALVAENQQQAQAIKTLADELAGWQLRYGAPVPDGVEPLPVRREILEAENQQLRDALEAWESDEAVMAGMAATRKMFQLRVGDMKQHAAAFREGARATLAGTPSEDTE